MSFGIITVNPDGSVFDLSTTTLYAHYAAAVAVAATGTSVLSFPELAGDTIYPETILDISTTHQTASASSTKASLGNMWATVSGTDVTVHNSYEYAVVVYLRIYRLGVTLSATGIGIDLISDDGSRLVSDQVPNKSLKSVASTALAATVYLMHNGSNFSVNDPLFLSTHSATFTSDDPAPSVFVELPQYGLAGNTQLGAAITGIKQVGTTFTVYLLCIDCTPNVFYTDTFKLADKPAMGMAIYDAGGAIKWHTGIKTLSSLPYQFNISANFVGSGYVRNYSGSAVVAGVTPGTQKPMSLKTFPMASATYLRANFTTNTIDLSITYMAFVASWNGNSFVITPVFLLYSGTNQPIGGPINVPRNGVYGITTAIPSRPEYAVAFSGTPAIGMWDSMFSKP